MDRRAFMGTLAAAGSRPARQTPLPSEHWGPLYYDEAERRQVVEVIDAGEPFRFSGRGGRTPARVSTFEKEFAARMKSRYALAVSSGTGALECAVAALGIGPGDEVILPAWTWHSTCTAVIRAGALPVFAEIDESFNIDPSDIESRITPQTKVIVAVHLQGNPADMDRILAITRKHRLQVLEDCAQAVGASYKGRPLGSLGDIGIYSHQRGPRVRRRRGFAGAPYAPASRSHRGPRFPRLRGLRVQRAPRPVLGCHAGGERSGAASCPRTIDILSRFAGVAVGPRHTPRDIDDVIAAIRKVHVAVSGV